MSENVYGIRFPDYVSDIISCLTDAGCDSYAVGGCIRDTLLGRAPNDWDITTAAPPEDMIRIFSESEIKVIGTAGIRHGTVMVKCKDGVCEITTFRSDGDYTDHRHPTGVRFSSSVDADLSRRDFTMNAIAAKPCGDGVCLVDPFGGIGDIESGVIRTVGDPEKRFTEDALRIMRAVRFSAELGFDVESQTADAAIRLRDTLSFVSAERITSELWKILSAEDAGKCAMAFPEIFEWLAAGELSGRFFEHIHETDDPYVRLSLIMEHGCDPSGFFARMRFPAKTVSLVSKLLSICDMPENTSDACRCMRIFGDSFPSFAEYYRVLELSGLTDGGMSYEHLMTEHNRIVRDTVPYTPAMLDVGGDDIIALGTSPRLVGAILEHLLAEVQAGRVPNKKPQLLRTASEKSNTEQ